MLMSDKVAGKKVSANENVADQSLAHGAVFKQTLQTHIAIVVTPPLLKFALWRTSSKYE